MSGAVESQDAPAQRRRRSRRTALATSSATEDQASQAQAEGDTSRQPSRKAADVSSSSTATSADAAAAPESESGGGESSKAEGEGSPKPPPSPEPNCAICLGTLENKSFTDSCFHMFCFVCLQEWSKVKAECPLCKQPFKSIIHNVRSYDNYDQFYLDPHRHDPRHYRPYGMAAWDRPFHHYRSTLTMDHRYMRIQVEHDLHLRSYPYRRRPSDNDPSLQRPGRHMLGRSRWSHRSSRHPVTTTVDFRRRIYENSYRVTGVQTTQRSRQVSPEFFSTNPAQTHRLMPWLNRELNALLYCHEAQVQFVMELILDLIKRFAIDSEEFYQHISPYIGRHTRHFMHEFLFFARSPYHMPTYDTKAIYEPFAQLVSSSESSDNDTESDVVVIDDDDAEEAGRPERREAAAGSSGQGPSIEPPAVRFGFDSSYLPTPAPSQLRALLEGPSSTNHSSSSWGSPTMATGWDSPTPGPSWSFDQHTASSSPVNVEDSSDSDASTIIDPAYISPRPKDEPENRTRTEHGDSDEEAVIFVGYDKPWEERSPIHLSSDSEDEALVKFAKKLKHEHIKRTESSGGQEAEASHSRGRRRGRSCSLTPPLMRSRSPHARSSGHRHHRSSGDGSTSREAESSSRRRHYERSEDHRTSSHSSSRDKRSHSMSSSHSKSSHKKRHHDRTDDNDVHSSSSHKKKRKHKKKHKKHKDKRDDDRHSKSDKDGRSSSKSSHKNYRPTSFASRDGHGSSRESFKKHPSGHKKSRMRDSGEHASDDRHSHTAATISHAADARLGNCTAIAPFSGNCTINTPFSGAEENVNATVTASAPTLNLESQSSDPYLLWSPLQMLMSDRVPQRSEPTDLPPTWENIKRLAGLLSYSATTQQAAVPVSGPGQSTSEPVVITTSSDESDKEDTATQTKTDSRVNLIAGSGCIVSETVVPCNSQFGLAGEMTDTSIATGSSAEEELIDVDSLSSCDRTSDTESEEIVDVESVDEADKDDARNIVSSLARGDCAVAEISAEPDIPYKPVAARQNGFSIESILNRDVFMGCGPSSFPDWMHMHGRMDAVPPVSQACVSSSIASGSQDVPFTHSQPQIFSSLSSVSNSLPSSSQHDSSDHSKRFSCTVTAESYRTANSGKDEQLNTSQNSSERLLSNTYSKADTVSNASVLTDAQSTPEQSPMSRVEDAAVVNGSLSDKAEPDTPASSGVVDIDISGDACEQSDAGDRSASIEEENCEPNCEPRNAATSSLSTENDRNCDTDFESLESEANTQRTVEAEYLECESDSGQADSNEAVSGNETYPENDQTVPCSFTDSQAVSIPSTDSQREAGNLDENNSTPPSDANSEQWDVCDSSSDVGTTVANLSPLVDCEATSGNFQSSSNLQLNFSHELDGDSGSDPSSTVNPFSHTVPSTRQSGGHCMDDWVKERECVDDASVAREFTGDHSNAAHTQNCSAGGHSDSADQCADSANEQNSASEHIDSAEKESDSAEKPDSNASSGQPSSQDINMADSCMSSQVVDSESPHSEKEQSFNSNSENTSTDNNSLASQMFSSEYYDNAEAGTVSTSELNSKNLDCHTHYSHDADDFKSAAEQVSSNIFSSQHERNDYHSRTVDNCEDGGSLENMSATIFNSVNTHFSNISTDFRSTEECINDSGSRTVPADSVASSSSDNQPWFDNCDESAMDQDVDSSNIVPDQSYDESEEAMDCVSSE